MATKKKRLTLNGTKRDQAAIEIGALGRDLQAKAREAAGDARTVLTVLADDTLALSRDLVRKQLSFSDYSAFIRKAKLTADSGLQRIAEKQAKAYVKKVLSAVTGSLLAIFG